MLDSSNNPAGLYFLIFGNLANPEIAAKLDCSARTVQRYRDGDTTPEPRVAELMRREISRAQDMAQMDDATLVEMAEKRRAEHEKRERETQIATFDLKEEKKLPKWFIRVRSHMQNERYQEAYESLADHIEDQESWETVDALVRTYVLMDMNQACQKTGRFVDAENYARMALTARRAYHSEHYQGRNDMGATLALYEAIALTNVANAQMKLGRFSEAFTHYNEASLIRADYAAAYYSALCCAAIARDMDNVKDWIGRLKQAAVASLSEADIETVLADMQNDSDLDWVRGKELYTKCRNYLGDVLERRSRLQT